MPKRGKLQKSKLVSGAYEVISEVRSSEATAWVTFHVMVSSPKEFFKTRKWHVQQQVSNVDRLELVLTPASDDKEVTICQILAESVPDSTSVRITFKGPRDVNPKGHLDRPDLMGISRRVRLALNKGDHQAYA